MRSLLSCARPIVLLPQFAHAKNLNDPNVDPKYATFSPHPAADAAHAAPADAAQAAQAGPPSQAQQHEQEAQAHDHSEHAEHAEHPEHAERDKIRRGSDNGQSSGASTRHNSISVAGAPDDANHSHQIAASQSQMIVFHGFSPDPRLVCCLFCSTFTCVNSCFVCLQSPMSQHRPPRLSSESRHGAEDGTVRNRRRSGRAPDPYRHHARKELRFHSKPAMPPPPPHMAKSHIAM